MISTQPLRSARSRQRHQHVGRGARPSSRPAAAALEALFHSDSGELRNRAIRAGAAVLDEQAIVAYLREEADDVLRNAGLEMLKLRGQCVFSTAIALLCDEDPAVVLQAVLVLDTLRDPRAWPHVRLLLKHDDPNVLQVVIQSAGHLSNAGAWPDLVPFLSADPWLQIAAIQALGDLRAVPAVPHLAALFSDPFLENFAAEALARIGDVTAMEAIADHWLDGTPGLEPCFYLEMIFGIFAHLDPPPEDERLRKAAEGTSVRRMQ
jgi:HEAT repeat protein